MRVSPMGQDACRKNQSYGRQDACMKNKSGDKMLLKRTNPGPICMGTQCIYAQRINVLEHKMYLWGYDVCKKGVSYGEIV